MILRHWTVILLCGASLTLANCEKPRLMARPKNVAEPKHFLIIFVDLTLSLNSNQVQSVRDRLAEIAANIPPQSKVIVYPLLRDVQGAGPIIKTDLGSGRTMEQRQRLKVTRGRIYTRILDALNAAGQPANRKSDQLKQTCIASALYEAAQQVKDSEKDESIDIILVSDMLESCDRSLFGSRLDFEQASIESSVLQRAAHLKDEEKVDLHGARVTVIRPASGVSHPTVARPDPEVVRRFWETVLKQCNVAADVNFGDGTVPRKLFRSEVLPAGNR
jgi:hypothetical protein